MAFMQHFELVNWWIRGFVFWCQEQVKHELLCFCICLTFIQPQHNWYARKKTVNGNDQNPPIQSHGNEPKLLDNEVNNNLFVTSKNETTNSPIHQFTNLKCCKMSLKWKSNA